MPNDLTHELLKHLKRDHAHIEALLARLGDNPDRYLLAYDDEQKVHIFKQIFKIVQLPYAEVDSEDKIVPILITGLKTYRPNLGPQVDLDWKKVIFNDAAKLCIIIRNAEHEMLDGVIYTPPTPNRPSLKISRKT